jgi:tetratricopeptide (TPR) repeat protein/predicted Ser/Thr protein kinase
MTTVGPFQILQKLGAGGMGDVYLAEDTRLDRKVALKCPSDSWLQTPDARARLQREARAAARLNHPNIAAIYDVFEIDGRPYIVIEYVEGEPLSAIAQRGVVPVEQAVRIVRQLSDGLEAAHAAGVIHRDLKPANVMITPAGVAKILDFGLARTQESRAGSHLTEAGQILGTPDYMAPEQFVGRPADERSDLYSLGALLYELVTGRRPFEAGDPVGRVIGGLTPPPARERNPNLPPALDALLTRALALDPRDRFQSATEFRRELERIAGALSDARTGVVAGTSPVWQRPRARRWFAAAAILLALIFAGRPLTRLWNGAPRVRSDVPVVAVPPLRNDTGDPANDYLGVAFSDSLITGLAAVRSLAVVSRVPVDDLKRASGDPQTIARAVGAGYVIDGSIQRSGERLKVNVRLVQPDNSVGWARDFEESIGNIFDLQRQLAVGVSEALRVALSPADRQRLESAPTANIAALRAYSEARAWLDQPLRAGASDNAVRLFREAIDRDTRFALAYAGLGDALWERYTATKSTADAEAAIQAVEHARKLDSGNPLIHLSLATSYEGTGRADDAVRELEALLTLQPNNDDAHRLLGRIYARQGQETKAVGEYQQAIGIRPNYWRNHNALGALYFRSGRFAEAAIAYQRVTELQPQNAAGYMNLGAALHAAGDIPRAIDFYKRSIDVGATDMAYSNLGAIYHSQRRYDDAIAAYQSAIRLSPSRPVWHRNLGDAYRQKGDAAAASAEYQRAIQLATGTLSVNERNADTLSLIAVCEAKLSQAERARSRIAQALRLAPDDPNVLWRAAAVEVMAKQPQEGLRLLERAIEKGFSRSLARDDDDFAPIRDDPRFVKLTGRQ